MSIMPIFMFCSSNKNKDALIGFTDINGYLKDASRGFTIINGYLKAITEYILSLTLCHDASLLNINKHSIWQQPDKLDFLQGN